MLKGVWVSREAGTEGHRIAQVDCSSDAFLLFAGKFGVYTRVTLIPLSASSLEQTLTRRMKGMPGYFI